MKRSIKSALILIIFFFGLSCSSYSIKNDIKDNSIVSKIKNSGIIFRIPNSSKITKEELIKNCSYWLSVYQKKGNVTVITDASDSLTVFKDPQQRFYQLSNEDDYLKFKSLGVVNLYLQKNQNELLNIISKNNFDSIIIFEVYSVISIQMQFFEFDSVIAIADANLNIGYLDHQTDSFESSTSSINDLKNQALDKINDRLIENLRDVNLLGKLSEGEKKILNKDADKSKVKTEEKPVVKPQEKTAEKKEEKPVEKAAEKQLDKSTVKPVDKPIDKPVEKPVEKTIERPAEKPADKPTDKSIDKPGEKAVEKPIEKAAEKQTAVPTEKPKEIFTPSVEKAPVK